MSFMFWLEKEGVLPALISHSSHFMESANNITNGKRCIPYRLIIPLLRFEFCFGNEGLCFFSHIATWKYIFVFLSSFPFSCYFSYNNKKPRIHKMQT